jgi:ABC-type bacteriocin/lantibiotic exporter with double-glycine peptidase domain
VPFFFLFNRLYLEKMHDYNLKIKTNNSQIQSHIQESIQHGTIIKSYGMVSNQVHQLELLQTSLRETILKKTKLGLILRNIAHVGFSGGYLLAFFWGAYKLYHRSISFGTVTAFLQLVNKIQQPIAQLIRVAPTLISTISAVERVMELEALEHESCLTQERISGNITLEMNHITFGYKEQQNVIENFNLKLHTGDTAAIVGSTGSGKTTILRLLLGFIKPTEGSMVMRTQHGSAIEISCQTRCNFVYVPQGHALFSGTIRDNLLIGNAQATDTQLIEALHTAVADFVFDLPAGLDTHLNEFGGGLSEGQAQRIAIARSLLHSGSIFLFDEISSALDEATEFQLIQNIASYNANKINIFVTHRPGVLRICDKVIEL